ncbi:MAG: RNA polymerase sigma factor [Myxococcales bacterium]|nr:RNA polymerase sigma factor [Myxococcales bacterium]
MIEPSDSAVRAPSAAAVETARPGETGASGLDDVMDRCARGEEAAFGELYRCGATRVRSFLLRLSGDMDLADDLTQETFLRIHRSRGSFATAAAALPWMLAIARNTFRDHIRRTQAHAAATSRAEREAGRAREAAPDTRGDETLAAREMLDVVRRVLARMPVLQREAFVLLRFEGLSVSQAAEVLGASEAAVKVRAFRAYEALRSALQREGERLSQNK